MSDKVRGRTGRRRRGEDTSAPTKPIDQIPFGGYKRPFAPVELASPDQIDTIHDASMSILENDGIQVINPRARDIYIKAGATIGKQEDLLHFDRGMIMEYVAKAPEKFRVFARNPAHDIEIGGDNVIISPVSSPPNSSDTIDGRRPGNTKDFRNFLKMSQYFNVMNYIGGYPVEPIDMSVNTRHLVAGRDNAFMTDKVFSLYALGRRRTYDSMEIARLARGVSREQFVREPSIVTVINSNSPRKLDLPMTDGIIDMARNGQPAMMSPFTLAGAMAPVTIGGVLALQNAEALVMVALAQMAAPGAPVVYGSFASNVDMKSGAPAFGTPEYMKTAIISGQLARRYKLPYRCSNSCAANEVGPQSAYESIFSLWGAIMGGVNVIKHGAGWMEGGLVASFEKFIIDVDNLQMAMEFLKPVTFTDGDMALDAISQVPPAGHFFGSPHTLERYQDIFYAPLISDWRNYELWRSTGSESNVERAASLVTQVLDEYEEPYIQPDRKDAINDFCDRRIAEGGAGMNDK